jgi:hypothetical protein
MSPMIFLSRPASLSEMQEGVFAAWNACLLDLGFRVGRLQRYQYSNEPWDRLRKILALSHGVAAFGFSQFTAGPEGNNQISRSMRTSPWIQIESGMAIGSAIPVLAVPEIGIIEGIFDLSIWSGCLYGIPAGVAPSNNAIPEHWIDAVNIVYEERSRRRK